VANLAIVGAGVVTLAWRSIWPDIVVGLGIALINLDAAREVWKTARGEHDAARS
jgi:Co/Zn/Cd efflux system component